MDKDATDKLIAAIFSAAWCTQHHGKDTDYITKYERFLELIKESQKPAPVKAATPAPPEAYSPAEEPHPDFMTS